MANKQVIFADRIVGLAIYNGFVRIDLAVVAGTGKTKTDEPALKVDVTHQLVIPLDGFVAGVTAQQNLLKSLSERRKKKSDVAAVASEGQAATS
ncbi:MAG: hypothetical protein IPF94_08970 [Betaproteobacteria bacterium]|nr:hypothetical protein [Betaproteobacteria bacterium]